MYYYQHQRIISIFIVFPNSIRIYNWNRPFFEFYKLFDLVFELYLEVYVHI